MGESNGDVIEHWARTGSRARKVRLSPRYGVAAALCVVVAVTGCVGVTADDGSDGPDGGASSNDAGTAPREDGATSSDISTDANVDSGDAAATDAGIDSGDAAATDAGVDSGDGAPPPLVCGDGIISNAEVCDDGNLSDGDGCAADCGTATCYVPVSHPTVTAALADAACPTVYVHSGTYKERLTIERDVTIQGVGALPVELDGDAAGTVVTIAVGKTVTLANLTVKNGRASSGGGIVNAGGLVLRDAKVIDNVASATAGAGGGIYQSGGSLELDNALVAHNHAQTTGPVGDTEARARGGGIYLAGGALTLAAGSKVEANDVIMTTPGGVGQGGGIYAETASVLIRGASAVRLNRVEVDGDTGGATAAGGGIYQIGGVLGVREGAAIDSNEVTASAQSGAAKATGAGAYLDGAAVVIEDAFVRTNEASAATDTGEAAATGGGMYVSGGTLSAHRTTVAENKASAVGGPDVSDPLAAGAGLALYEGTATLTESAVIDSLAEASVVGDDLEGEVSGGGIDATSTLSLHQSTVSKNKALGGRHVYGGGLQYDGLALDIRTSTFAENEAVAGDFARGGGLYLANWGDNDVQRVSILRTTISGNITDGLIARGGGIFGFTFTDEARLDLRITSSTLSGNESKGTEAGRSFGAGLYAETGTDSAKTDVTFNSCTIAYNEVTAPSGAGGGIYARKGNASSATTVTMRNTIVANNTASSDPDCVTSSASITSAGYNFIGSPGAACSIAGDTTGDLSGAPELAPLANNGGSTLTHALLAASPAKDAGNPAGCADESGVALAIDQRGAARVASGRCDIGAVESH